MWMLFLPAFQTWFPTSKIRSELCSFVLGRETGEACNDFLVPPGICYTETRVKEHKYSVPQKQEWSFEVVEMTYKSRDRG